MIFLRQWAGYFLLASGLLLLAGCAGPPPLFAGLAGEVFPVWRKAHHSPGYTPDDMRPLAWLEGKSIYISSLEVFSRPAKVKEFRTFIDICSDEIYLEARNGRDLPEWFIASTRRLRHPETRTLSANDPRLTDGLQRFLKEQGLENPKPHIVQAVETDLDGDGDSEAIISAEIDRKRYQDDVMIGDYSLVAFGDLSASQFTAVDFYGAIVAESKVPSLMSSYHLVAIVDIDSDGRFDLAVGERGYEWNSVSILLNRKEKLEFYGSAWCGII